MADEAARLTGVWVLRAAYIELVDKKEEFPLRRRPPRRPHPGRGRPDGGDHHPCAQPQATLLHRRESSAAYSGRYRIETGRPVRHRCRYRLASNLARHATGPKFLFSRRRTSHCQLTRRRSSGLTARLRSAWSSLRARTRPPTRVGDLSSARLASRVHERLRALPAS